MNVLYRIVLTTAVLGSLGLIGTSRVAGEELRPATIYGLEVDMETQDAKAVKLSTFAGEPLVISMFYSSCDSACPLIINNVKSLERRLSVKARKGVRVLLVSFDPDTDTPDLLKKTAAKHRIDLQRWTLARASANQVENLAAVLGIKYKKIDAKTINHTSVITVVARDGRILKQTEQFGDDADALAEALKSALAEDSRK